VSQQTSHNNDLGAKAPISPFQEVLMAQVKIIRDGVFAGNGKVSSGTTVTVTEAEAKAMIKNGLATEVKKASAPKAKTKKAK
jgi:hypothetical protein